MTKANIEARIERQENRTRAAEGKVEALRTKLEGLERIARESSSTRSHDAACKKVTKAKIAVAQAEEKVAVSRRKLEELQATASVDVVRMSPRHTVRRWSGARPSMLSDADLANWHAWLANDAFARSRGLLSETDADDPQAIADSMIVEMGRRLVDDGISPTSMTQGQVRLAFVKARLPDRHPSAQGRR